MKTNGQQKLKICMLLPPLASNMRVNPQIGICSYLTNFGHEVSWVISLGKDYPPRQFLLKGAKVNDIPYRHYFPGDSLLAKVFNRIPNILRRTRFILKVFREEEYNLIFVRDEPFDGLIATYLKRRYKVPFVYELTDPLEQKWSAFRMEPRKPKLLHYLATAFDIWLRILVMKKADLVLTTTRWFEEGLVEKGISKSRLMPYPNGAEIDSFLNKDGKNVHKKYHLTSSKVIIYVGAMSRARNLGVLIEAFPIVRQKYKKVKLLMVGDGTDRENLERLATKLGIEDEVIFTGRVPQTEVPHFIAASDIGVSTVPPLSHYRVSSPIKIFEYMAASKPVVANEEIFEHKEILGQSRGGLLVAYTPEAFAEAIIELLNNPEMAPEMGRRGQGWVVKNRSYDVLARRLESKYFELLNQFPAL